MRNSTFSIFASLLLLLGFAHPSQADNATYLSALDKELDNRSMARQVVPALAARHGDTPQGRFWSAYTKLEQAQLERYKAQAQRHGLSTQGRGSSLKVYASLAFARLFNASFIAMLANATQGYLEELQAVPAQDDVADQAFWDYVIAQERAQVDALALAAERDFIGATAILQAFVQQLGEQSVD